MEEKELSLDELDNVFGGISREAGIENALENSETYRQKQIEELKKERDAILSSKEYQESHANTQSGRSK